MKQTNCIQLIHLLLLSTLLGYAWADVHVSTQDLELLVGETKEFILTIDAFPTTIEIQLVSNHAGIVEIEPNAIQVSANTSVEEKILVTAQEAGHAEIYVQISPNDTNINASTAFVRVSTVHSYDVEVVSIVIGWLYFVAWSISFYPQIFENWRRKSVIGLNFDFLVLNIIGFALYSIFNSGLYWIAAAQVTYYERYPHGTLPVLLNDVVFGLHAVFATALTIIQCSIYERGEQKVSRTAKLIVLTFAVILLVSMILSATQVFAWLDFLYICSYVKLIITLIKYVPQAYMNYRRKSTIGWSIGNIFLDFTGGALSMLQMLLNAYNYNDWVSIFGDPTKFGLGLFSVLFDVLFIVQHYILYRHPYEPIPGEVITNIPAALAITEPIYS